MQMACRFSSSRQKFPPAVGTTRDYNHEMKDQLAATSAICASSERITCLAQIPEAIDRAFEIFHTGRPRSVHIGIPVNILSACESVCFGAPLVYEPTPPDPKSVGHAARLLRRAQSSSLLLAEALSVPFRRTEAAPTFWFPRKVGAASVPRKAVPIREPGTRNAGSVRCCIYEWCT